METGLARVRGPIKEEEVCVPALSSSGPVSFSAEERRCGSFSKAPKKTKRPRTAPAEG